MGEPDQREHGGTTATGTTAPRQAPLMFLIAIPFLALAVLTVLDVLETHRDRTASWN